MPRRAHPLRIAIDTGGTFTDCVWIEGGQLRAIKVFSTPADPSEAIVEAIGRVMGGVGEVHRSFAAKGAAQDDNALVILHGTTVGTNTLLERKGARTALATTAGFEDAIEIGRQARPKLYDFFFDRIEPLVPRELRFGIEERTASAGEILIAPSPEQLRGLAERVASGHPQSIAISLLFSFANPQNEKAVAEALRGVGVPISLSHQILPEFREYERASTVVINAYLQPVMQRYLTNLESRARGPSGQSRSGATGKPGIAPRIFVMQSSGGIAALSAAAREPVRTVLSGPAGGVVGAAAAARASGFERVIGLDMGGTSTDVSLVEGAITTASDSHVAGLPIGVPMLDIHTVGAGGGSVARFDAAGLLRVGPESAGADPGPICYGRGVEPTVTDANLLLGRLPASFLGGEFALDGDRTRRVTAEWLARHSSRLRLEPFAAGVIRVVNAVMEKAMRAVSIERGRDPRDFALLAFGGAGGLHACELAEALRIPRVIIPAFPGALSAFGILMSDVAKDYSRTLLWGISGAMPMARLRAEFSFMEEHARRDLAAEGWGGRPSYQRSVDLRYRGQGYELNIPLRKNPRNEFEREHLRRYGYAHQGREIELVTVRLRAVVKSPGTGSAPAATSLSGRPSGKRAGIAAGEVPVFFGTRKQAAKVYAREQLKPGRRYSGPAVITEYSATSLIPPRSRFHVDGAANLIVTIP